MKHILKPFEIAFVVVSGGVPPKNYELAGGPNPPPPQEATNFGENGMAQFNALEECGIDHVCPLQSGR